MLSNQFDAQSIWDRVRTLFEVDDGSLPDIFIESLTNAEIITVYSRVMSRASIYNNPGVWSIEENRTVPLKDLDHPARLVLEKKIEPFRHGLVPLNVEGVKLPELTIGVDLAGVSFDYRMDNGWGSCEVLALLEFLFDLVHDLPSARVVRAEEGAGQSPSPEFSQVWNAYRSHRMISKPETL